MTEQPVSNVAEIDETVTCAAIIDDEDMGTGPCGATSRFIVSRSDGDESYGSNGGSEEACEEHLADAVVGMIDGDVNVNAIVALRWEPPEEMPLTATERLDVALRGAEIITAAFSGDDDPCEDHGGEGSGSNACPGCRERASR